MILIAFPIFGLFFAYIATRDAVSYVAESTLEAASPEIAKGLALPRLADGEIVIENEHIKIIARATTSERAAGVVRYVAQELINSPPVDQEVQQIARKIQEDANLIKSELDGGAEPPITDAASRIADLADQLRQPSLRPIPNSKFEVTLTTQSGPTARSALAGVLVGAFAACCLVGLLEIKRRLARPEF